MKYANPMGLVVAVLVAVLCWGCEVGRINVPRFPLPAPVEQTRPVGDPDELYARAEERFNAKAYGQALPLFNDYLARFARGAMADAALMRIAAIYEAIEEPALARDAYERLIRDYPGSVFATEARFRELTALMAAERYDEAIRKAAVIDPKSLETSQALRLFVLTGDAYIRAGLPMSAAAAYGRAHVQAPETDKGPIGDKLNQALALLNAKETETLLATLDDNRVKELIGALVRKVAFQPDTIGVVLPLTGKFQNFGRDALRGIELAFEGEGNRSYGPKLKLVIKDTASDPQTTVAAIRQLEAQNQAAAVIGPLIAAEEAAKEAQALGLPIITLTQKEAITQTGSYVLRHFITPHLQTRALVQYAVGRLGLRRFAVLYPEEPYGRLMMNLFWDELLRAGGQIVGAESYNPSQTDFTDPIKKLTGRFYPLPADLKEQAQDAGTKVLVQNAANKISIQSPAEAGPPPAGDLPPIVDFQALFIPDGVKKMALILPQLTFHDVTGLQLLGTNLWHSKDFLALGQDKVQGAIFCDGFFSGTASPLARAFIERFRMVYGSDPGFMEAIAYDTARMVFQAVSREGIGSRDDVRDALLRLTDFAGVTGNIAFDMSGDAVKNLFVLQAWGDGFVELQAP